MKSEVMDKPFGKSEITRRLFEGLPCPICTTGLSDDQMQELADAVENEVKAEYPDVADRMFEIWRKNIDDRTYEEVVFLSEDCYGATELWWELLEEYAIGELGAKYYAEL